MSAINTKRIRVSIYWTAQGAARFRATYDGRQLTIPRDYALNWENMYSTVAQKLGDKLGVQPMIGACAVAYNSNGGIAGCYFPVKG